jgi:hypothetical protein
LAAVGEDVEFPGRDPALAFESHTLVPVPSNADTQTALPSNLAPYPSPDPDTQNSNLTPPASLDIDNTTPVLASEMRQSLKQSWLSREAWKGYSPQLGFNPSTGEPWMSVRTYASNGYPALSGSHHRYLHTFEKQIPEFDIRYERFNKDYVLIWPEFKDPLDILKEEVWEKFGRLRAFLANWASEIGRVECIYRAHRSWLALLEEGQKGLDVPEGFVREECRGYLAAVAMKERAEKCMKGQKVDGEVELEKFPRTKRVGRVVESRRGHREGERSYREERDSHRDRAHRTENENRIGSSQHKDNRTERRESLVMIDRYRPMPRAGLDDRCRPRRSRSRSRSRGSGGLDQYRPVVRSRSEAARETDRYRPRY